MKALFFGSYWMGKNDVVYLMAKDLEKMVDLKIIDTKIYSSTSKCYVEDFSNKRIFPIRWLDREKVLKEVAAFGAEAVIICAGGMSLTKDTIEELQKINVVSVGISLSDPDVYFDNGAKYSKWYDLFYTNSWYALKKLYKDNSNCHLLPFAASPSLHRPLKGCRKIYDLVVVGHARDDRLALIKKLQKKFKIGLFGKGWYKNKNTEVHGMDHVRAINSGKLYLSFANTSAGYTNVKVGLFEAAACGVPVICQSFKELENYYTYGIDILGYKDESVLEEMISFYLKNEKILKWMANNIYIKTMAKHTWQKRWESVIKDIVEVKKSKGVNEQILRAQKFLLTAISSGLAQSFDTKNRKWLKAYPEVTGYLVSYFCQESVLPKAIIRAANKLVRIQNKNGGFSSFYEKNLLYTFDSAQIAKALVNIYLKTNNKKYYEAALRTGEFMLMMQKNDGSFYPIYDLKSESRRVDIKKKNGENWGSIFSYIQLKNIEALNKLYEVTGDRRYFMAANKLLKWGLLMKNVDFRYTHPLAYYLEGLWAAGEKSMVKKILKKYIVSRLNKNGFIEYFPKSGFAYVSGSAQLAILLYKVGYVKESVLIRNWLRKVSEKSKWGGLFQYANKDAEVNDTIHSEINTWGTKYFCELERLFLNNLDNNKV